MLGRVWLLNFWASWCPPCREEHPLLVELARSQGVAIVGINYKDDPARATAWLKQLGDPYVATVADPDGRIGIDFGVYGMPETFLIDRTGVIRYKRIGAITRERLEGEILPLLKKLHAS
jgi:cytochrome c biogenesis protein CcmG/thiol:disulfide interchange protein DsbE